MRILNSVTPKVRVYFQTHRRSLLVVALLCISVAVLGGSDDDAEQAPELSYREQSVAIPQVPAASSPQPQLPTAAETDIGAPSPPTDAQPNIEVRKDWTRVTVRPGQTLAKIFSDQGLGPRIVHRVVHVDEHTQRLTRIFPGDELAFQFHANGALAALEYQLDEAIRLRVVGTPEGEFVAQLLDEDLISQLKESSGVIEDSLFLAGRKSGLTDSLIMELAGLFGWDVDFVLDIRSGDSFHLIYEEIYRNGEFLRTGDIVAATFVNQGRRFQAVRFETENGFEYFAPDGRNMKKAFLRAPLNFSYISSSFNPRRFHPILKRFKPHNGIDYRAPSGTPVFASGNGKVIDAGYSRYNGNYVFVQHGNNIVTKYLHFSKKAVKKGQRVQQGQTIGYVGATGLAEAPHLHYEFLVNGVHRNPRTVDLPKADPLPDALLLRFQAQARPLLAQLERLEETRMLASAE